MINSTTTIVQVAPAPSGLTGFNVPTLQPPLPAPRRYLIEYSDDLVTWHLLPGSTSAGQVLDLQPSATAPRHYRLQTLP